MRASVSFVPLSHRVPVLLALLFLATVNFAQITPSDDAYVNSAAPTTNYGAAGLLNLQSAATTSFIRFDLTALPAGYTGASVAKATLKLYVNTVATAGSFNVDLVNGVWSERTITYNLQPVITTAIVSGFPLATSSKGTYVEIDITSAMVSWLNGTQPNDGIALVANTPLVATFDSKENTAASHPPEIDIVFAGISGVTTASGSGITGGGTGGTLTLSLLTSCTSGQVLKWNGSAWACSSTSSGTITGVIAGTDLTGGGNGGKVTLNLDITKVPQLNAANVFTGNQTVNGNLSSTGTVTGSGFQIGSNLFAYGSYSLENVFFGFAGNTTTSGAYNTATGYGALAANTTGVGNTANGIGALSVNNTGNNNTAIGNSAMYSNTSGGLNIAIGAAALSSNSTATRNVAIGPNALDHVTTGGWNTAVGAGAGITHDASFITGYGVTFLGAGSAMSTGTLTNATAIGNNAEVDASNAMVLGAVNGVNGAAANTNIGIGTTAPSNILTIGRGAGHAIADGWDTYSSRRWKTNIHTLHSALEKVEQLRGVSYDLKANGKHEVGVIAEEVGAIVPEVVTWEKNGTDAQSVDYGRLTALLIEAAKEQQTVIRQQRNQIRAQQAQIARLTRQVKTIQATLKAGARTGSPVRTVKAERTAVHQE